MKLSTRQILGVILIISAALPYIPVVNKVSEIGLLATFVIGVYLLLK